MAAVTTPSATAPAVAGRAPRGGIYRRRRRRQRIFRIVVLLVFGAFFLIPLYAMVAFSLEGTTPGTHSVSAWTSIFSYPGLGSAIAITLELAVITGVVTMGLLLPTMIWVRLKVPRMRRVIEFICLLPLTIPAIVLVVGLAPVYRQIRIHISLSALMLFGVYVILALPYAYRALANGLESIDARTLAEAARSLGASWFTVIVRVIVPNLWQAILNATLLTVSLVLGEFTIASLLLYINLQVALYDISRSSLNAGVLFSTSAAALLFSFILLLALSYVGRRRDRRRRALV
ncbi:MAG TPA: ABC transporter permease subunit [Actinomycetota bacterium]|jgi:putative spermidine/putrescine transport system permease protein